MFGLRIPTSVVEFGQEVGHPKHPVLAFVGHMRHCMVHHFHDHFGPGIRDKRPSVLGIHRVGGGALHEGVFKNRLPVFGADPLDNQVAFCSE